MPKHLTDAQVGHYRDRGYVSPVDLLTESEATEARAKLEAYEAESGGPLAGAERAGGHLLWMWLDELMRHETLLDAVEAGEEDICPGVVAGGVSQGLAADPKGVEKQFAEYLPG